MRRADVMSVAALALAALAAVPARAGEGDAEQGGRPAGRDLFGTRGKADPAGRAAGGDAPVEATVTWSDGRKETGRLSFTAGVPLTVYVLDAKEWADVELADLARLTATPRQEQLDREWRWKEYGSDEKVYTGRTRPRRWLDHEVELRSGERMKVHVKGTVAYLDVVLAAPDAKGSGRKDAGPAKPDKKPVPVRRRLVLRQYERGEWGDTLETLVYVKSIAVGDAGDAEYMKDAKAAKDVKDPEAKPPAGRPGGAD